MESIQKRKITTSGGKIPPQALDLEEVVLGAMLIDHKAIDIVFGVFTDPAVFYKEKHQHIFKAIKILYSDNNPIDILSVSEQLKTLALLDQAGGDFYLISLTQKVSSSAHTEFHSRIILQKFVARQVIKVSNEFIELAYNDKVDVFDLVDGLTAKSDSVASILTKGHQAMTWYDAMMAIPKRVEFITNNSGEVTGVPTGLDKTDNHFSGWQAEDFIVMGADSGMGKTAFVLNNLLAVAKTGDPVGMFSMEMSVIQLAIRGVAVESNFHLNQLMRTGFDKSEYWITLQNYIEELKHLPIFIDDQPALTVMEMKRKARAMVRNHGIKMLVIDFIQMFAGDQDIRINVSEAARACKNLAKELKIPVIALSQLSREVRKAKYCIPSKHHLKESSAIEEAADVIMLFYRPSYYGYTRESHPEVYEELGLIGDENACGIVAKNRNGSLGNIPMIYIENKTKFTNALTNNTPF